MAEQRWYWWGVLVARDKHAKQRQVYVSPAFDPLSGTGQMGWVVESWSKGLTGKLWSVRQEEYAATFEAALKLARAFMREWCDGYVTVEEGEPPEVEREEPPRHSPEGLGTPGWWARELECCVDDDQKTVYRAWLRKMKATHPDAIGDESRLEECKRANAAWEWIKQQKKWN